MPKKSHELISVLKNKNIIFSDVSEEKMAENFIEKYNYSSVISLKYLFATGITTDEKLIYHNKINYKDIKKQYLQLVRFENKIRESILEYEAELKVKLVNFISEILRKEQINFERFIECLYGLVKDEITGKYNYESISEDFKVKLSKEWDGNIKSYSPNYRNWDDCYYLLIKILSFGRICKFLDNVYQNVETKNNFKLYKSFSDYLIRNKIKFSIGNEYSDLRGILTLRNALCHKESLVTFLDKGYRKDFNKPKTKYSILKSRQNSINSIYVYRNKGKKKNKGLDFGSWVMSYERYRVQKGVIKKFKKIKINL